MLAACIPVNQLDQCLRPTDVFLRIPDHWQVKYDILAIHPNYSPLLQVFTILNGSDYSPYLG